MTEGNTDRFSRQQTLVPRQTLESVSATVIGVGAIGRQVALQLAAIGSPRIQLIDFDSVDTSNITTQGYDHTDVGELKVAATRKAIDRLDNTIEVLMISGRYNPRLPVGQAIFCCVDSISVRAAIWKTCGRVAPFWADGRMLGEDIQVLAADNDKSRTYYPTTIFSEEETVTGSCTSKSTIYAASIAAGFMVHQFTRWLRGVSVNPHVMLSLWTGELAHIDVEKERESAVGV